MHSPNLRLLLLTLPVEAVEAYKAVEVDALFVNAGVDHLEEHYFIKLTRGASLRLLIMDHFLG